MCKVLVEVFFLGPTPLKFKFGFGKNLKLKYVKHRAAGMVLNMVGTTKTPLLLSRLSYRPLTYSLKSGKSNPRIWWGPVPTSPYIPAGLVDELEKCVD